MSTLFGILFLLSIILLIVGLIKPSVFHKKEEDKKKLTRKKLGLGFGTLAFIFMILGAATTSPSKPEDQKQDEPKKQEVADQTNLSDEDKIKQLVIQNLKGKNNMDRDYLKNVEVTQQDSGGWNVLVDFNAADNLTTNLRKGGIEGKMSEIYKSLFTSSEDIKKVSINAYFPLTDQYGNESDGPIYETELEKTEADKINWQAPDSTLKLHIIPGVWTTIFMHREFK